MIKNNIRQSVIVWNNRFPLDRWWRKKYNIPYLSDKHRESSFFCQYYEYYEEKLFKEYNEEREENKVESKTYEPLNDSWWKGKISTKEEVDDWFSKPI